MALLEEPRDGSAPGDRARRALVFGAVGAAFGFLISGFLSNIADGTAVFITLVGAAIGAWLGWTPRHATDAAALAGKTSATQYVGAHAPDEASVRDVSSPLKRHRTRPAHP